MKTTEGGDKARERKSLTYFHCEAGSVGVGEAGNAYQSPSLVAAGSDYHGVGVLTGLTNLVTSFLYLQIPSVVRLLGSPKRAVLVLSFLDALTWLPILAVMLFLGRMSLSLLIVLWIVNLVPGMMVGPIRAAWIASLTSAGKRGQYLGQRLSIATSSYLVSFYAMGYLLRVFSGEQVFIGFAIVFSMAFGATLLSFFMYTRISEPSQSAQQDDSFGFADFLRETRTTNLGRFILYTSLFIFVVYLASPYFAVYMLSDLRFDYITFAIVSSSELVARIVAMPIWGHYARFGNLRLLRIASLSIPLVPILWLASHNLVYLVLVQLFSGVVWAGFDLCVPNFIYQAARPEKRFKYIVFYRTLSTAAMALGSLTAVLLLNHLNPILGSQILALFLLSGILRFAVAITLLPRVRELPSNNQTCLEGPVILPTGALAFVPNSGLLHRPEQWSHFTNPSALASRAVEVMADVIPRRLSLLYRPREWRWFNKPLAPAPQASKATVDGTSDRRQGFFYRQLEWHWFNKPLALAPVTVQIATGPAAEGGLFYRPQHWQFFRSTNEWGAER